MTQKNVITPETLIERFAKNENTACNNGACGVTQKNGIASETLIKRLANNKECATDHRHPIQAASET